MKWNELTIIMLCSCNYLPDSLPCSLIHTQTTVPTRFKKCKMCGELNQVYALACTKCKNKLKKHGASHRACPSCGSPNHNACSKCSNCKKPLLRGKSANWDDFLTQVPLASLKKHIEKRVRLNYCVNLLFWNKLTKIDSSNRILL